MSPKIAINMAALYLRTLAFKPMIAPMPADKAIAVKAMGPASEIGI
jgi:hypothetical protein